jgi:hypothetical protein
MRFIEYTINSEALCMGERTKAGLIKPTCRTIRYSQITGALRRRFGEDGIHAVGFLIEKEGYNQINYLTYSPRDRILDHSKIPLQVEYLTDVLGKVFVLENELTQSFPDPLEITMGALLSKGFGKCILKREGIIETDSPQRGYLRTRIPEELMNIFGIVKVLQPVYGYLFKPTSPSTGVYVKSLFEGSLVIGPQFILTKGGTNGQH